MKRGDGAMAYDGVERTVVEQPAAGRLAVEDEMNKRLDMSVQPRVVESTDVYVGPIFTIKDQHIALRTTDGGDAVIRRQLIAHAPAVIMLPHDTERDLYLVEREYRVGCNAYVMGLPAGMIDAGEDPEAAMLRELREETGVIPDRYTALQAADCYSSEGMTDEHAYTYVIDLERWHEGEQDFDADEYVEYRWVTWDELVSCGVREAHSFIAIQYEMMRRMKR